MEGRANLQGFDFPSLMQTIGAEESQSRTKAEVIDLLTKEGEIWAKFVEGVSEDFLAEPVGMPEGATPPSKSRLEMILSVKEHEMHHRGQLMLIERMVGVVPHLTRQVSGAHGRGRQDFELSLARYKWVEFELMPPLQSEFTRKEWSLIRKHRTPLQVQRYLRSLPYNWEAETLRTFRKVVELGTANCIEAALGAATIMEQHGYPPLLLDIESIDHLDHVLFLFNVNGGWGAIAKSRDVGLHGRKPAFSNDPGPGVQLCRPLRGWIRKDNRVWRR